MGAVSRCGDESICHLAGAMAERLCGAQIHGGSDPSGGSSWCRCVLHCLIQKFGLAVHEIVSLEIRKRKPLQLGRETRDWKMQVPYYCHGGAGSIAKLMYEL
ncbi:hypothetical protein EJB05_01439 [Eragrostis curvula]|uniref:Uncharacterized protein n=1 Tax=Eragrostis curvula TaxID=38414 RepID=A0A5J9WMZ9_9POAL|nr:hypothetical protein EJB05_01439 [Eragrostis curvula]